MTHDISDQSEQTMRRVFQEEVPQLVRTIIREEVPMLVRAIVLDEVPALVRTIVREETQDIREDVAVIRQVQQSQSTQLQSVQVDIRGFKTAVRSHGILLEDLESRFSASHEVCDL